MRGPVDAHRPSMFAPQVDGYDKALDTGGQARPRARAKKLLAEAGYPQGFEVTLDCPNNRYINDEKHLPGRRPRCSRRSTSRCA